MENNSISEKKINLSIFVLFLTLIPVIQIFTPFMGIVLFFIYKKLSKEIPFENISKSAKRLSLWWIIFSIIEFIFITYYSVVTVLTLGHHPIITSPETMLNATYILLATAFVHLSLCLFSMVKSLEFKFRVKEVNKNYNSSRIAIYFVLMFWLSVITSVSLVFVLDTINIIAGK